MKTNKVLITDSLFIFKEHEQLLIDAGFEIERIDKPEPTEEELVDAINDKVGYILGGVEHVTEKILANAEQLKAIVFTGIDYKSFIPAWEYASSKGIAIANVPNGPTYAVAEWSITMALAMNRGIFGLGRAGDTTFKTTKGLQAQHVGLVGFGRIGSTIAKMIKVFEPTTVSYSNRTRREDLERELNVEHKKIEDIFKESDVVFICIPKSVGEGFIGEELLSLMKSDALLVNITHPGVIDQKSLLTKLEAGQFRAVSDHPATLDGFSKLPLDRWYCFNGGNAFNTFNSIKETSDKATKSLINLLKTGEDEYKVTNS
ncbi:NAD(P)-binding domain-containing protein [Candidatus Woesebacteria bacterium]|nr:NAD(P)-binding domain-containing protein [Candidatus Woesebacteria bacterium]